VTFMRTYLRMMEALHQTTEHGLALLKDEEPILRERLQEAHDMFSLIEGTLPTLLKHIEEQRRIP
jgi:hypothetical protein